MPIGTFALIFASGKMRGRENSEGVRAAVRVVVAPEIFGPAATRTPMPARVMASARANKPLALILTLPNYPEGLTQCGRGTGVGRARGVGVTLGPGMY